MSMHVTNFLWFDQRFKMNREGYYMDEFLAVNLMGVPKYLDKSYDCVGIVSGHGKVRIGKTSKKGSKVLMANGEWKNVEDIKKGDLVISPDIRTNKYSIAKVIETHSRYCNNVYDICNKNTNEVLYTCSDNHEIPIEYVIPNPEKNKVIKFNRILENIEAKNLAQKSLSWLKTKAVVTYQGFLINNFQGINNATIEPYSLGVYLGDGNANKNKGNIKNNSLSITCSSEEVMFEVSQSYPILSIYKKLNSNKCKSYHFSVNSNFYKELIKYKLENKISGNKFIPEECKKSDSNYRLRLLAGLIDTDGYINKQGIITYTTKSLTLAKDIQEICRSLGGNTNIKQITKTIKKINFTGTYYNVQINLGDLNNSIPLKRPFKINRLKENKQLRNKIGIIAKKGKSQMVYGFQLDSESHLYITDNFCITHQSTIAQQVAYFLAWLIAGGKMGKNEISGKWFVKKKAEKVNFNLEENIVFSPEGLMKKAAELYRKYGRNQVIIYDEGRAGLDSAAAMSAINKAMQDFFQECGMYGHVIIIVLPNFFKLHEDYAVNRSLFLIDAYADRQLRRGYFNFYNETQKEWLYYMGKKKIGSSLKYSDSHPSFSGRFTAFLPLDKDKYEDAKREALKQKELRNTERKWKKQRDAAIYLLRKLAELSLEDTAKEMTAVCGFSVTREMVKHAIETITHEKTKDEE